MDKKHFLHLDECLRSAIKENSNPDPEGFLGTSMDRVSLYSCLILGMRSVAYRNRLSVPYRDERDDYFANIGGILETIYSGFSKLPFVEKIKIFSTPSPLQSDKEKSEAALRILELCKKMGTSWIEKC